MAQLELYKMPDVRKYAIHYYSYDNSRKTASDSKVCLLVAYTAEDACFQLERAFVTQWGIYQTARITLVEPYEESKHGPWADKVSL